MDELNFDHQLCTFHLEKHLWKLVNKEANKIEIIQSTMMEIILIIIHRGIQT